MNKHINFYMFSCMCVVLNQKFSLQNLVGIFKSNFKYGPPEIDDRKRRKYFDEIAESRQCQHNCMVLDVSPFIF